MNHLYGVAFSSLKSKKFLLFVTLTDKFRNNITYSKIILFQQYL